MIAICVEFIDQLIGYPINRASLTYWACFILSVVLLYLVDPV